jgi:hypothetical protein
MTLHNADLSRPVPNEPEGRRMQIVNLYRIGKKPWEIAQIMGVSVTRVHQILKEETAKAIKRAGTDGLRVERVTELEILREHLFPLLIQTNEDGEPVAPNNDTLSGYLKVVDLQGTMMGVSAAGPLYTNGDMRKMMKRQPPTITFSEALDDDSDKKR